MASPRSHRRTVDVDTDSTKPSAWAWAANWLEGH